VDFLKGIRARITRHSVPMVAAGVAFYAMLAIFPALIAVVTVYALLSDPAKVGDQVAPVVRALPSDVGTLLRDQLRDAVAANHGGLTVGLVASLLGTLWAASGGVNALTKGLAIILEAPPRRSPVKQRALSVALTLGALVAAAVALALITVFPVVLGHVGLGRAGRLGAEVLRWLLLLVLVGVGLAVIYRLAGAPPRGLSGRDPGSGRRSSRWRLVSWGVGAALVVWILGSVGFTVYVSNFGRYNKTYGSLAAVIVLLLWLYLSSFAILLGAVVDAQLAGRRGDGEG
jgi:membrane protein